MKKFILLLAFVATSAFAQTTVSAPWVRATVPQQTSSGAFMQLTSPDDAKLVAVQSPLAGRVEIHEMQMQGETMRMRAVDSVALPAGKAVNLASGGYHVMLMDLKGQLKAGATAPLTLVIEHKGGKRETLNVSAPVKPLTFVSPR